MVDLTELRPPVEDGPWPPMTHLPPLRTSPLRGATTWTGLTYAQVPGFRPMVLDLHVPDSGGPAPVVMWVHGGGWAEGDRRLVPLQWGQQRLFQKLVDAGFAVATPDHRLIEEVAPDDMVRDLVAAVRYLRTYAADLRLDGRTDVSSIIWWYGAADLTVLPDLTESLWRGVDPDAREWLAMAYSPVTHVRADSPPMLIMHGDSDKMSPLDQAVRLHDAARAAGAWSRLVVVPGAEHVFLGADIEAQWQVAIDFLGDTIGPRA